MQAALADLRAVEASIEKARSHQSEQADRLNEVQASYYQLSADATRLEQSIQHARELRQRQRTDLEQTQLGSKELAVQLERDEAQVAELLSALRSLEPDHVAARERETASAQHQQGVEASMQLWQGRWEEHGRECGAAGQSAQVERARIEEIENRLRHLRTQLESVQAERSALEQSEAAVQLELLSDRELVARKAGEAARQGARARAAGSAGGSSPGRPFPGTARRVACQLASRAGATRVTRGAPAGRAGSGAGPRHGVARLALVRGATTPRTADSGAERLGARGRNCPRWLSRGCVRRWPRRRHGSPRSARCRAGELHDRAGRRARTAAAPKSARQG